MENQDPVFAEFERIVIAKKLSRKWTMLARQIGGFGSKGYISTTTIQKIFKDKTLEGRTRRVRIMITNWIQENRDCVLTEQVQLLPDISEKEDRVDYKAKKSKEKKSKGIGISPTELFWSLVIGRKKANDRKSE